MPFRKGDININRKGAPKRDWTWSGLLAESMDEQDETGESYKKIIVRKVRQLGMKGDMVAIKELFNRMDGMPQQDVTSGGEVIDTNIHIFIPNKLKNE